MKIGRALITIRDMRADWLKSRHVNVLVMLVSRLPHIFPTCVEISEDTKLDERTVRIALKELRDHKLIEYESGSGKRHHYKLCFAAMLALVPEEKRLAAPPGGNGPQQHGGPPSHGQPMVPRLGTLQPLAPRRLPRYD